MKKNLLIILIMIVGFLFRISWIGGNSLYGDELTLVYDAYSILKTGHDSTGKFLPVTFEMRGGSPGGYVYGAIPFVAIFGPNELGIRSLSILSGIGIVILLYFLGSSLFSEKVGIWGALIAAISPWEISLSRGGYETHFALFLALLGTLFLEEN